VLSEAYALVCVEDKDTIKYENIFESCCQKDTQHLLTQQNTPSPSINKSIDKCCIDYEHNYTYVPEQYVMHFNFKDFSPTKVDSKEIAAQYSSYYSQKITSINFYNLYQIRTTVIRI
jgi:hypothetical protein